jgi:hypothetical protein
MAESISRLKREFRDLEEGKDPPLAVEDVTPDEIPDISEELKQGRH